MMVIFSSSLFLNCPYFILTSSRELYISSLGDVSKCRCYISSLRSLIAIKLLIFVKLSIHIFMFLFISQYRIRSCSVQIFIFYPCLFSFTCIMFHFFSVILFCDSFISFFFLRYPGSYFYILPNLCAIGCPSFSFQRYPTCSGPRKFHKLKE